MADDLFIRYGPSVGESYRLCAAEVLWIEFKRVTGKNAEHQKRWHAAERARGALVIVALEDFEASIEGFQKWYRSSGLMRRKI